MRRDVPDGWPTSNDSGNGLNECFGLLSSMEDQAEADHRKPASISLVIFRDPTTSLLEWMDGSLAGTQVAGLIQHS